MLLPATLLLATATATTNTRVCSATLTVADARTLVLDTPNARAFKENYGAKLRAALDHQVRSTATFRVLNDSDSGSLVGLYTVNLRTGAVLDDDQEPAEDAQTQALSHRLIAHRCAQ
ncbi:hypothetical protein [Terriglobus saanensis]|uniref:Uncharacterized protein n=1 Tax=Terriglobus saanensis (strain ATCC BAA-1853 / DSM 23119 / SP1PR4) TaxID=401053 RepID=E8V303_TERSS|nr:hypothetical protein [Terriglobus saanensis]ADV81278.1 hypothetical protein AciPR4_0443 [Terriglobus saanensis SP1PR4]